MAKTIYPTSISKNRNLREYILKKMKSYKNLQESTLLEIGCGNGRFGHLIGNFLKEYRGIEPDNEYLKIAKSEKPFKNITYKKGNAEKIPYKRKFDIIFYSFSWHQIKDYKSAINEAKRVLKKDGIIFIIEPNQKPFGYANQKFNETSKEFDKELFERKVSRLRNAENIIGSQKAFKIIESIKSKSNLWIMKF